MPIFAIVIGAKRAALKKVTFDFRVMATRKARSKEEAIGIGIQEALSQYPQEAFYTDHRADAIQIPPNWIAEAASALRA